MRFILIELRALYNSRLGLSTVGLPSFDRLRMLCAKIGAGVAVLALSANLL
jgi:hypothetical protein